MVSQIMSDTLVLLLTDVIFYIYLVELPVEMA